MTTDRETNLPARRRVALTGISSRAWEHPADRGALTALRELRGFDDVIKSLSAVWSERAIRAEFLGGAIRVDHRQYPRLHRIFAEAASTLDIAELPELYVQNNRTLNGMCIGMAKPFIVLNSGSLELLEESELRCMLGHELGHLRSGHSVYKTMAIILTRWALRIAWFPVGSVVLRTIVFALEEWWRKAELSADRAGLLACQDPATALRVLMKLAGGGDLSEIDTAAFLEQAAEYDRMGDLRDSLIKLRMILGRSHPLPVARASELRRWIDDGSYQRIIGGEYPRRDDDARASVTEEIRAAAASYRESFARSEDPLMSMVNRVGDGAGTVGDWVGSQAERVRRWVSGTTAEEPAGQSAAGKPTAAEPTAAESGAAKADSTGTGDDGQ